MSKNRDNFTDMNVTIEGRKLTTEEKLQLSASFMEIYCRNNDKIIVSDRVNGKYRIGLINKLV